MADSDEEFSKKVKTALGETRVLILGAQVLLGFQFRGVFSQAYPELPRAARLADAVALGLMVCVVGLLITPGPYHRIVEGGEDSTPLHRLVTAIADAALLPFALALGLNLFVVGGRLFGRGGAIAAGAGATLVALGLWYLLPHLARQRSGAAQRAAAQGRGETRVKTPLHAKIEQMLTESRVVLPGAQALLGFQLSIVLTESFANLPATAKVVHAASLCCLALSVMLLMAPAAYHRIVFAGEDTPEMHRAGSIMLTAATIPLAFGLAGSVYVVIGKVAGSPGAGLAAGVAALILLIGLWHAYPLVARQRRRTEG